MAIGFDPNLMVASIELLMSQVVSRVNGVKLEIEKIL